MQELDMITFQQARNGDRHAFKKLYDLYAPFLWRVLFPMAGRDMNRARDLLQETFIKTYRSLRQFKGQSALSTWLYRIAYTTALAMTRNQSRHNRFRPITDTISGNDRADSFDERQLADRILNSLSPEDRFLLVAREIDDIPFDDLAAATGLQPGALRTRLHRLKETIRRLFPKEQYAGKEVCHEY